MIGERDLIGERHKFFLFVTKYSQFFVAKLVTLIESVKRSAPANPKNAL